MNIRFLTPPGASGTQSVIARGPNSSITGTYSTTAPGVIDVVATDAGSVASQGWIQAAPSGPTSARPAMQAGSVGATFVDTTLGALIFWDGTNWRNASTGANA